MTFAPACHLPAAALPPDSADFDYVPAWTTPAMMNVLDSVDHGTRRFLVGLVLGAAPLDEAGLAAYGPDVLRLIESLWTRGPSRQTGGPPVRLPARLSSLSTVQLPAWRTAGQIGAAWTIARLGTFRYHMRRCGLLLPEDELDHATATAWQILHEDEGSYLYTAPLAARYERDRPHDSRSIAAIDAIAARHCADLDVLELGAGTGAITRLVVPHIRSLTAVEPAVGMRTALHRRTRAAARLTVIAADAMRLPLSDHSIDTAYEHAALCFVDEPIFALAELRRVLRPAGSLVRIISTHESADRFTDFAAAFHAELRRHGYGKFPIVGKGNDRRLTNWLATKGVPTRTDTIAHWSQPQTLRDFAAPLVHASYPYLTQVRDDDRTIALDVALATTGLNWNDAEPCRVTVATATSPIGNILATSGADQRWSSAWAHK